ncbi:MAG: cupin domain-containing protein [Sandaracinus sp.]
MSTSPAGGEGVRRRTLEQVGLSDGYELRLMRIEYAPGVAAQVHRHPVAGLCYVLQGEAESQYEGRPTVSLRAGDSYEDLAEIPHLVWRNRSDSEALVFLCAARLAPGQAFAEPLD